MRKLTVFTPTYNRKDNLQKCYQSLVMQKNANFVWQIVDDGSTDGTVDLVNSFIKENKIKIEYYYKENGGKTSAINFSLKRITTPFWVCLDSDDYLLENAVQIMISECEKINDDEGICGVFCVRSNSFGKPMKGIDVPETIMKATQAEIRYKYSVPPEYVQVYKTSVIKEFEFPIYQDEKFMVLSWMQDQLDCKYCFKIIHEPIMVCEYLNDGITKNYYRLMCNNPKGFRDFYSQRLHINKFTKIRIISGVMYNALAFLAKDKKAREHGLIPIITFIPGFFMSRYIVKKGRKKNI